MSLFKHGRKELYYKTKKERVSDCAEKLKAANKTVVSRSILKDERKDAGSVIEEWVLEKVCSDIENYKDPLDGAAYLLTTLANEHAFLHGNKRTATIVTEKYLEGKGYALLIDEEDYKFIKDVAAGNKDQKEVNRWLKKKAKKIRL